MLAKQLSIFLENKSGRLTEVTDVLGEAGVNLSAMSIADNSDFGILRCIVSDPDKAYQVLKAAHFAVKITDVIGFVCPNTSGSLAASRSAYRQAVRIRSSERLACYMEFGRHIPRFYCHVRNKQKVLLCDAVPLRVLCGTRCDPEHCIFLHRIRCVALAGRLGPRDILRGELH